MLISEEGISPSVLSFTLLDSQTWDPGDIPFPTTNHPSAQIATGSVAVFMWDVLGEGPISLRIVVEADVHEYPGALNGRVLFGSGQLLVDEAGSGSFRSGATITPAQYRVRVDTPPSAADDQIYTVTLFDPVCPDAP